MGIERVSIERFRCLESLEIEPHSGSNVIVGENGAGKTSILEALFFLGRGRSFRPGGSAGLIQDGAKEFILFAEVGSRGVHRRLGLRLDATGLQIRVDGEGPAAVAELAAALPLQVIEPEIHELVQGGPQGRRRFVDWGVFHVKHEFYPVWRRYRRALQQRNLALRQALSRDVVQAWDQELIGTGQEIDRLRRNYLEMLEPGFARASTRLLGESGRYRYRPGWPRDQDFRKALAGSWERDTAHGRTHVGPHLAELVVEVDEAAARNRLSRGQQKLLGISMVLAQARLVSDSLDTEVTLLVDEPSAELDETRLKALLEMLEGSRAQLFITALDRATLPLESPTRVFHVERGKLVTLV